MRFVQALHYTPVSPASPRVVRLVVLHSMESQELAATAENTAAWFAGQTQDDPPQASAHYCVDGDSIVQCVREEDVAWHAQGANRDGIGVELAGRAAQTTEEWFDDYSTRVLELGSALVADICLRHAIPASFLNAGSLVQGLRGITTHAAVVQAYRLGNHTDPGAGFPMLTFVEMVRRKMSAVKGR
jgi:N-acetyl-anhydromuramyl-L-alanine amidase AmpD